MRIKVGDWVVRIEKGADSGLLSRTPWRVKRSDDKGHLLLCRDSSTLWATSYFRLATQDEIDNVSFKMGDYVNHNRPMKKPLLIENPSFSGLGTKPINSVWRHATPEEFRIMMIDDTPANHKLTDPKAYADSLVDSRDEIVDEKVDTSLLKKVLAETEQRLCALEMPNTSGLAYREKLSKAIIGFRVRNAGAGQSFYTLEGVETKKVYDVALEAIPADREISWDYVRSERNTSKASGILIGKAQQKRKDFKFLIFAIAASATVSALTVAGMLL